MHRRIRDDGLDPRGNGRHRSHAETRGCAGHGEQHRRRAHGQDACAGQPSCKQL